MINSIFKKLLQLTLNMDGIKASTAFDWVIDLQQSDSTRITLIPSTYNVTMKKLTVDNKDLELQFSLETINRENSGFRLYVKVVGDHNCLAFSVDTRLDTLLCEDCYSPFGNKTEIFLSDVVIFKPRDEQQKRCVESELFYYNDRSKTNRQYPRVAGTVKIQIKVTVPILSKAVINLDRVESPEGRMQTQTVQNTLATLNPGTLVSDLKAFCSSENNFPDLKLKSMDNMIIKAHKLILAARSPYLRNLLEEKCGTPDFDGTLGLDDVNAKPLITILHWMYCEELPKDTGRFMDEVIVASKMFQLKELLETLDRKMILFCELENMLELFRVAQKHSMKTAMKDISAFVKRNIDKLV